MNKVTLALVGTALTLATAPILTSCSDDEEGTKPAVAFAEGSEKITLGVGDTYQIELLNSQNPTYTSEDEYFATVSETGMVTARHTGKVALDVSGSGTTITDSVIIESPYSSGFELLYGQYPMTIKTLSNVKKAFGDPYSTKANNLGGTVCKWKLFDLAFGYITMQVVANANDSVIINAIDVPDALAAMDGAMYSTAAMKIYLKDKYDYIGVSNGVYTYSYTPKKRENFILTAEFSSSSTTLVYFEKRYFEEYSASSNKSLDLSLENLMPEFDLE